MIRAAAAALLLLLVPAGASAHEVVHAVERARALSVHVSYADGEPLAYVPFEVFSPADPKIPHLKGRTDRAGYVAFVPDAPGKWRVRVADESGHGLDVEIDAAGNEGAGATKVSALLAVRPFLGVAMVGLIFGGLFFIYRRKFGGPFP